MSLHAVFGVCWDGIADVPFGTRMKLSSLACRDESAASEAGMIDSIMVMALGRIDVASRGFVGGGTFHGQRQCPPVSDVVTL